jgi:hypothetical protein
MAGAEVSGHQPDPPGRDPVEGYLTAVAADLALPAIIAGQALTTHESSVWAPVLLAAGASRTRLTLGGRAARRCLAARAARP